MNKVFMDVHVLQTVPPSCVNRDDAGMPKTAMYGGVTRARVSSQCWKHAMRGMFKNEGQACGIRTRNFKALLKACIAEKNPALTEEDLEAMAADAIDLALLTPKGYREKKNKKESGDTDEKKDAILSLSRFQAEALAGLAVKGATDQKAYKEAIKKNPDLDMLLFGRMVATDPDLNYDAAVQVAHAISVHAIRSEYDYFTAVDDYQKEDSTGAAHMDTAGFNSSTLYRYTNIDVSGLVWKLGPDAAAEACAVYLDTFVRSMPAGKQNSFANCTLPDVVYVTFRTDQPVNLAGAFEKPIEASGGGYTEPAQARLYEYADSLYENYGAPVAAWEIGTYVPGHEVKTPLPAMLDEVGKWVRENVRENL